MQIYSVTDLTVDVVSTLLKYTVAGDPVKEDTNTEIL